MSLITAEMTAKGMAQAHGSAAADEAKKMIDRMTRRGDTQGREFWDRVYKALRPEKPAPAPSVQPESRPNL